LSLKNLAFLLILASLFLMAPGGVSGSGFGSDSSGPANYIALEISSGDSFELTPEHLQRATELGIRLIVTDRAEALPGINADGFLFILSAAEVYPTRFRLSEGRQEIASGIAERYRSLDGRFSGRISAIELFRDGDDRTDQFARSASQLADTVSSLTNSPLFYSSRFPEAESLPAGFDFRGVNVGVPLPPELSAGQFTRFVPSLDLRSSLSALRDLFEIAPGYENSVIVLPADWFFEVIGQRPDIGTAIGSYTSGRPVTLPLPAEEADAPMLNWSVFFLFILWISFMVHFRFQPVYGQSMNRYFMNHVFYVIDVMEHRIRNALPGVIVLVQHSLLTGLFLFVSAEILISEAGLGALSHHFPFLFITGNELISLFFWGVLIAVFLQFTSVIWIHLLNKNLQYFSQTLNLYSWPLHINLLIVTLLVVFNQAGMANALIAGFSILYALVWFMSFNVAAIDAARFLDKGKVLNIFLTVGVHTLVVVLAAWYLLITPGFIEPVRLALALP
jgi:hypothetical protein